VSVAEDPHPFIATTRSATDNAEARRRIAFPVRWADVEPMVELGPSGRQSHTASVGAEELVAAQKLGRWWVGIDVTYLSIAVMKGRLRGRFGIEAPIIGAPTELEGARARAEQELRGHYQF
jgi:hypothetical protein